MPLRCRITHPSPTTDIQDPVSTPRTPISPPASPSCCPATMFHHEYDPLLQVHARLQRHPFCWSPPLRAHFRAPTTFDHRRPSAYIASSTLPHPLPFDIISLPHAYVAAPSTRLRPCTERSTKARHSFRSLVLRRAAAPPSPAYITPMTYSSRITPTSLPLIRRSLRCAARIFPPLVAA